jgi:hypothetical protein
VQWSFADGTRLTLLANAGTTPWKIEEKPPGSLLYSSERQDGPRETPESLQPWSTLFYLDTSPQPEP